MRADRGSDDRSRHVVLGANILGGRVVNLGKLIDRARMQMSAGRPVPDIRHDLMSEGHAQDTIYWALRGARFELDYWNRISSGDSEVKAEK